MKLPIFLLSLCAFAFPLCAAPKSLSKPSPTPADTVSVPRAELERIHADFATASDQLAQADARATAAERALSTASTATIPTLQKQVQDIANEEAADEAKIAALQTKYNAAVKTIWWYRLRFWGPLTMAVLALAIYVFTRFTSWGARTFGPYILGAEKVAAKAAVLV